MEIKWYGNNCFYIKGDQATVLIDPTGKEKGLPEADIVISSDGDVQVDANFTFDWPGEYEARDVIIHCIPVMDGDREHRAISMEIDGIRVGNLGVINDVDEKLIEELGDIDVLMVPATTKPKEAVKTVEEVDPRLVIPSMADSDGADLAGFLKEAGQSGIETQNKISIKNKAALDSEAIEYASLSL